jgi:hypothetical protein
VNHIKRNGWGWAEDGISAWRVGVEIDSKSVGEATSIVDFSLAAGHWEILHYGSTSAHEIVAVL